MINMHSEEKLIFDVYYLNYSSVLFVCFYRNGTYYDGIQVLNMVSSLYI